MTFICRHVRAVLIISLIAVTTSFCASKNYLKVNYQLPTEPALPQKTAVSLTVKDIRQDPAILTEEAKKALKQFDGFFVLIILREIKKGETQKDPAGALGLNSLVKRIFRERLEHAGIQVAAEEERIEPVVEIILKEFKLDLVKHKWIMTMSYQANLIKENRVVAGEIITGSAERLRVISGKNAELVIGDLMSDVVNRLNLNEFLKAGEV